LTKFNGGVAFDTQTGQICKGRLRAIRRGAVPSHGAPSWRLANETFAGKLAFPTASLVVCGGRRFRSHTRELWTRLSNSANATPSPTQGSRAENSHANMRQLLRRSASGVGRGKNPTFVLPCGRMRSPLFTKRAEKPEYKRILENDSEEDDANKYRQAGSDRGALDVGPSARLLVLNIAHRRLSWLSLSRRSVRCE
jgi:hypothetical protein